MKNITDLDMYLFGQSTHYDIYKKMGAHLVSADGKKELCLMYGRRMRSAYG